VMTEVSRKKTNVLLADDYDECRKHQRFSAETIYAAITIDEDGRGLFGDPLVPIDISEGGLSFLSNLALHRKQKAFVVLAGYGVISGYLQVTIERTQKVRPGLYRYGASIDPSTKDKASFDAILRHCSQKGSSRAAWK